MPVHPQVRSQLAFRPRSDWGRVHGLLPRPRRKRITYKPINPPNAAFNAHAIERITCYPIISPKVEPERPTRWKRATLTKNVPIILPKARKYAVSSLLVGQKSFKLQLPPLLIRSLLLSAFTHTLIYSCWGK